MFIYLSIKLTENSNIVEPRTLHVGSKLRHIKTSIFFCWLRSMFSLDHLKTNLELFHYRSTVDYSSENERSTITRLILMDKYWWNYVKLTITNIMWSQVCINIENIFLEIYSYYLLYKNHYFNHLLIWALWWVMNGHDYQWMSPL